MVLVSKHELRLKPTWIGKLYGLDKTKEYTQKLIEPQVMLFDCYKKLLVQNEYWKEVSLETKELFDAISI